MKTKRILQFSSLVLVMVMVFSLSAGAALSPVQPEPRALVSATNFDNEYIEITVNASIYYDR